MTNNLERRKFLQICSTVALGNSLVYNPLQLISQSNSYKKNTRFKLSKPKWNIYENGSYDLISDEIILKNCRPAIDGQAILPKNIFLGDSPKGKRIVYELLGGFLMLDLKTYNDCISIAAEFNGFSQTPEWFFPISQAEVFNLDHFFRQGFGTGDYSGVHSVKKIKENRLQNASEKQTWSFDSYLTFAFLGKKETIAIGNLEQDNYLQRSTIYNRPHRQGLQNKELKSEQIFFESGILLEKIKIKNEYLKLPELHFYTGNKPFETFQELAWRTSEKTKARQGSVTSFHWVSKPNNENSFEKFKSQVDFLDSLKPVPELHTLMVNKGYCEIGDWLDPNDNWPGGLDRVAREIFKDGYRAGIWIAPFVVSNKSKIFKQHKDWLAKDLNDNLIVEESNTDSILYVLDISHSGVQKYLTRIFSSLRKMGFIFYELDKLIAGFKNINETKRKNTGTTAVQLFRKVLDLIRFEIGEGSLLMANQTPYSAVLGMADIVKLSDNVSKSGMDEGFINRIQESYILHYFNNIYWQNNPGYVNLVIDNNTFTEQEITSAALWFGILGGAVGFSNNLTKLKKKEFDFMRFLEPTKQQKNATLPFWPDTEEIKVAVRVYKKQNSWGVLFFNDKEINVEKKFQVNDLIGKESAFVFRWKPERPTAYGDQHEIAISLPPHQSRLFYLSEKNEAPPENLTLSGLISK